jgi:twinkle protein
MQIDRETAGATTLDKLAGRIMGTPNLLRDLDLTDYMDQPKNHNVKPASDYKLALRDLMVGRIEGDPHATGLPFNYLRGKFEFRRNELTIWTGYKGHGKSLLISQAFNAAIRHGKRIFIFSPEFRPERVLERMLYQHAETMQPRAEDLEAFMAYVNDRVWLYDTQGSLSPREVVALCRYVSEHLNVDHILIDSLMKCGMPPDDYSAQKMFVDQIQTVAHAYPLHIHLVAHARKGNDDSKPPRLHDIKGASEIADMAENVLCVWRNKEKEKEGINKEAEPDASLTVEAQRNGDGWIGTCNLMFERDTMRFFEPGESYARF